MPPTATAEPWSWDATVACSFTMSPKWHAETPATAAPDCIPVVLTKLLMSKEHGGGVGGGDGGGGGVGGGSVGGGGEGAGMSTRLVLAMSLLHTEISASTFVVVVLAEPRAVLFFVKRNVRNSEILP
eukprot:6802573-Prymnesium_polylepis.1